MTITGKELDARNGGMDKAVAERGKAVGAAILAIEKQFGAGSIMKPAPECLILSASRASSITSSFSPS